MPGVGVRASKTQCEPGSVEQHACDGSQAPSQRAHCHRRRTTRHHLKKMMLITDEDSSVRDLILFLRSGRHLPQILFQEIDDSTPVITVIITEILKNDTYEHHQKLAMTIYYQTLGRTTRVLDKHRRTLQRLLCNVH